MALRLRCAIYTRKSSEEGLEQDFNSLHAQREACEAYVKSQVGEGWSALPTHYDDGGFSGGSMERPGLKALLDDIGHGRVDVVVVYKVDRLTRSLADFAKIVEAFDARGVSFVSVTQAFNTTTSMGRLTLNVLLSFAQFEREVTSERIRDKIAASKAKGMWMGGIPPLGYDAKERTLAINEAESSTVRRIFQRYLEVDSAFELVDELDRDGVRSKAWTTAGGQQRGGLKLRRGAVFHILKSRVYLGEIVHKDKVHPGQHPPIIERELFEAVEAKLAERTVTRSDRVLKAKAGPLMGKLIDERGQPYSPTFSYGRNGRPYRYYVCSDLQRGHSRAASFGPARIGAEAVEGFIRAVLERLNGGLLGAWTEALVSVEARASATHILIDLEQMMRSPMAIAIREAQNRLQLGEVIVQETPTVARLVVPSALKLRGGAKAAYGVELTRRNVDEKLVRALRQAHADLVELNASPLDAATSSEPGVPANQHGRLLTRLAILSPKLQRRILDGTQPRGLTVMAFLKAEVPLAWPDQEAWAEALP